MRLVSALSFALLLSLAAPQAHAAAQTCKEGAKATINGQITTVVHNDTRTWLVITTSALDCSPVIMVAKGQAEQCPLGSKINAAGTLFKPDARDPYLDWSLSDQTDGKGARHEEGFSCRDAPPLNPKLKSWAKPASVSGDTK